METVEMTTYVEYTASSALPELAVDLLRREPIPSRDGDVHERLMSTVTLFSPEKREILVPGRRASIVSQVAETMWVLAGRNDVGWLKHYLPRAPQFSDDGLTWRGGYGPRLRRWRPGVDQLAEVVRLLKEDPETRRAVMVIFDPAQDYVSSKDIPCNNWLSFVARRGVLHLNVAIRSNDLIWGWSGINAFEWSVLLEVVAHLTGNEIGEITFNATSLHAYTRHDDRLRSIADQQGFKDVTERVEEEVFSMDGAGEKTVDNLDSLLLQWFDIEERIRTRTPGASDALQDFPEPMMRSWLGVIYAYWNSGNTSFIPEGGRLIKAYELTPDSLKSAKLPSFPRGGFRDFVDRLHREKSVAYKGSWCKRGEIIGIMANLARKADRLGVAGGGDTSADTVIDFFVYLMLYRLWLTDNASAPVPVEGMKLPAASLDNVADNITLLLGDIPVQETPMSYEAMVERYEEIEDNALDKVADRYMLVDETLAPAYTLAYNQWRAEQNDVRRWGGYGDSGE